MKNLLLTIEYDGTNFSGWQRQPDRRTVQGELEKALSAVCRTPITINGTSRTDAGVHALGQRASFIGDIKIPTDKIALATNNFLAGGMHLQKSADVRIVEVCEKPLDFHARFSANGKKYVYKIIEGAEPDIFKRNYYYQRQEILDIEAMKKACGHIIGTHDFKCFQAAGGAEKLTTVRTIDEIRVGKKDFTIEIEVAGDGFLYNMVRIIAGTLVEVGLGKRTPESLIATIESKDRSMAGHTAPPQGLYLKEVYYDIANSK